MGESGAPAALAAFTGPKLGVVRSVPERGSGREVIWYSDFWPKTWTDTVHSVNKISDRLPPLRIAGVYTGVPPQDDCPPPMVGHD